MKKKKVNLLILIIFYFLLLVGARAETNPRPWIGIEFRDVTEEFLKINNLDLNSPKNIIVTNVVKTSAAHEAGIMPGDIFILINQVTIKNTQDLIKFLGKVKPGDTIIAQIHRNGSIIDKKITLKKFPSPDFKPQYLAKKNKFKEIPKKNYTIENSVLAFSGGILYPNYFSQEILSKYNHNNLTISCIPVNQKNNLKLYDQIKSINGKSPFEVFPLNPNENLTLKIVRDGKIITVYTKTVENKFGFIRHDCTPEYVDFDCAVDMDNALSVPRRDENDNITEERVKAHKKTLDCFLNNEASVVPFHNIFAESGANLKFDAYLDYLYFLQYQYPEGHKYEQKNLPEIKRILEILKKDIDEFDKFQKIYPDHNMMESYEKVMDRYTSATTFAGSLYTGQFLSTKSDLIKSDKDIVKKTKTILENKIKKNGYDSLDVVSYLDGKRSFFEKSGEYEYLIKHYLEVINKIDFSKKNYQKFFYDYYFDLASIYNKLERNNDSIKLLERATKIAKLNYNNLIFMSAYGDLINTKYTISMLYGDANDQRGQDKKDVEYTKLAKEHLNNLDKLSDLQKTKMYEIDDGYYLSMLQSLHISESISISKKTDQPSTYWALRSYNYAKSKVNLDFTFAWPGIIDQLLQASILDDDKKNFDLAKNEFKILLSNSVNNKKKLYAIFNYSGSILQNFESNNLYSDSDELIKFIDNTFDLDSMKSGVQSDIINMIMVSKGRSLFRNKEYQKTLELYEKLYFENNIEDAMRTGDVNFIQTMIIRKAVPILFEIYASNKKYEKIDQFSNTFFLKNTSDINNRDLKNLKNVLSLDAVKIYKSLLFYYDSVNNKKKFKLVNNHVKKNLNQILNHVKNNSYELTVQTGNSKINILNELADIGNILVKTKIKSSDINFMDDGRQILDKIYPIILTDFNDNASKELWKPNLQDGLITNIYLDLAQKEFSKSKSFFKKAYHLAQASKNTYNSRDLSKALKRKNIYDPDGLIQKYESLSRELSVNLRNKQFSIQEKASEETLSQKLNERNRELQNEISYLEDQIHEKIPSYFKLTKIQTAKVKDIQNSLNKKQVFLDYFFLENNLKIILVTKNNFKVLSRDMSFQEFNVIKQNIRNSLIPNDGNLKPYAVNSSYKLNNNVFLFLNSYTKNFDEIVVIPDGPLGSIPLHALSLENKDDCMDCRNISFNYEKYHFNYYPSAFLFANSQTFTEELKNTKNLISKDNVKKVLSKTLKVADKTTDIKGLKVVKNKLKDPLVKLKEKVIKKNNQKEIVTEEMFYLGIGDPNLYQSQASKTLKEEDKITMLRSLFQKSDLDINLIKEIYGPVYGSADEVKMVAKYLEPMQSQFLLKDDANEKNIKNLDLSAYKIIHFATHGEISGAISGINEPFLLLTPTKDKSNEDGLLTMSEIMMLDTNADIVILSACNTASGDEVGSEGFSGLAKSFFMSGSKSILVSNWYVETNSAKDLVINIFKHLKNNKNNLILDSLNFAMSDMHKNQADRSHPMFWAPFVLVGENTFSINF